MSPACIGTVGCNSHAAEAHRSVRQHRGDARAATGLDIGGTLGLITL
jgi:hypothetical protein